MEKTILYKVYSVLYQTICYALLLVNLIHVGKRYFSYDTDTSVGFYSPVNITSPNLSLCFDLNSILGRPQPTMFYSRKPQYVGQKDRFLFSKVPRVDKILKKCAHRDAEMDQFNYSNGSQCLSIFDIKRYRMQHLMCYLFRVVKPHTFIYNALSFSVNEPRLLYKLVIDAPLNAAGHTVVPLVHFDELADVDRMFMSELFPSKRNNELYYLEYDHFEIYRLPYPYTTNCAPEPHVRCFYNCVTKVYAKQGLTASSGISLEAQATESSKVINNSIINPKLDELVFNVCLKKLCKFEACLQKLVITLASGPFDDETDKLTFIVGAFKYPVSKIIHSAKLPLLDYLTQCFSLSGIWVGFSVTACITLKKGLKIAKTCEKLQLIQGELIRKLPRDFSWQNVRPQSVDIRDKIRTKWIKKILTGIFKFVVVLIFSVQAINQCVLYAQYQTVLYHDHIINPEFEFVLPSTAVCIYLEYSLLNLSAGSIDEANYEQVFEENFWKNLTVAQIFNRSINEEMLFKCRTKNLNFSDYFSGQFKLKSRNECLEQFTYHKYYSNWQVCYMFTPKKLSRPSRQWEFVFREARGGQMEDGSRNSDSKFQCFWNWNGIEVTTSIQ